VRVVATGQSATVAAVIRWQLLERAVLQRQRCGITEDSWRLVAKFSNGRSAAVALEAGRSVGENAVQRPRLSSRQWQLI